MQYLLVSLFLSTVLTPTGGQNCIPQIPNTNELKVMRNASVEWQNIFRTWHHSPPLELDDELNKAAQEYAAKLASLDKPKPEHSVSDDRKHNGGWVGENMAWMKAEKVRGQKQVFDFKYEAEKAAKLWYAGEYCDPEKYPRHEFDHWTQVLWKNTKKLGIGMAYSYKEENDYLNLYIVARYYPAGNIQETCSDGKTAWDHNLLDLRCNEEELCPAKENLHRFSNEWNFKVKFLDDNIPKNESKCPPIKEPPSDIHFGCGDNGPEEVPNVIVEPDEDDWVDVLCLGLCASKNLKPVGFGSSILIVILLALAF